MSVLPIQKLPFREKDPSTAEGKKHCERTMDFYIGSSSFGVTTGKEDLLRFYGAYNGELYMDEYEYVLNPFKIKNKDGTPVRYPARMRNHNIIKPPIDMVLGEKNKRYTNFTTVVLNDDVVDRRRQAEMGQMLGQVQSAFMQELNQLGVPTGQPDQEQPPLPESAQIFQQNYRDSRALEGEHRVNFVREQQQVADKHQTAFFDWLVAGRSYSYKGISNGNLVYDIISPTELDHDRSTDHPFIEDRGWCVWRRQMQATEVIDRLHDLIAQEKDPDELTEYILNRRGRWASLSGGETRLSERDTSGTKAKTSTLASGDILSVYLVQWKSPRKVGKLRFYDALGFIQEDWVDEDYKVRDGEEVEWHWINEVWEGYRIDENVYLGIRVLPYQRSEIQNPSKCKLGFNGRIYSDRHAEAVSLVGLGMAYQILVNIYLYRFEMTMAKNKDKLVFIDQSLIPRRNGWDEEKFFYHADASGFAVIDQMQVGAKNLQGMQDVKVLDLSLGKYAEATLAIVEMLKKQFHDLIGFTPQRMGETAASDGLGKTQQMIFQSSIITDELIRRFEKWQETEYQGFLDLSKHTLIDRHQGAYLTNEFTEALFSLDPGDFSEAEIGIRIMNSGEENEKLQLLRQQATQFAQNGVAPEMVADILAATSFTKIRQLMKKQTELARQMQQQSVEQQQQHEAGIAQLTAQTEKEKFDHEQELKLMDLQDAALDRAQRWRETVLKETGSESASEVDPLKMAELELKRYQLLVDQQKENKENIRKREETEQKLKVTREQLQQNTRQQEADRRQADIHQQRQLKQEAEQKERDRKSAEKINRERPKPTAK